MCASRCTPTRNRSSRCLAKTRSSTSASPATMSARMSRANSRSAARAGAPTSRPARGLQSIEYLICLARAHLVLRSRAVEVTFECAFERAIELSCRKNARVFDTRLPGGSALGKIIKYGFSADGDTGKLIGTVTIGCAIGFGGAVADVPGAPTYVAEGYVGRGYQFYADQVEVLPASDVGYSVPIDAPNDDGLVFPLTRVPFLVRPQFVPVQLCLPATSRAQSI